MLRTKAVHQRTSAATAAAKSLRSEELAELLEAWGQQRVSSRAAGHALAPSVIDDATNQTAAAEVIVLAAVREAISRGILARIITGATPAERLVSPRTRLEALPELGPLEDDIKYPRTPRPQVRADCKDGPRPCPWVACRHNLYLDVQHGGLVRLRFPEREPHEMTESCALDVAEKGGLSLEAVARLYNTTRERIRQIEASGLRRARGVGVQFEDPPSRVDQDDLL